MSHVTYTELRQNLARFMDEASDSRAPVIVTRQGGKGSIVLLALEEFESWQETVHLLSSPANAERLIRSIRSARRGKVREHTLIEPAPPDRA